MNAARVAGVLVALVLGTGGMARAQRGIDAELFRPSMDGYGIVTVERAEVSRQFDVGFRLWADHAGNPLHLDLWDSNAQGARRQTVIERQTALHLGFHIGLTDWLELATVIPVTAVGYGPAYGQYGSAADPTLARTGFYQGAPYTNVPPPDAAPLDARLGLKARLFRKGIVGMALLAVVSIPFGDDTAFLGDSNFTFRPTLALDLTRGSVTVAFNVGAIVRQTTTIVDPHDVAGMVPNPRLLLDLGHELTWGVGVAWRFVRRVGLFAELFGYVPLVGQSRDYTADALGGFLFAVHPEVSLSVGGGGGIIPGAYRRDEYRGFLGITWAPPEARRGAAASFGPTGIDSDGDGIVDTQDQCPSEPEDKDGFQDDDGCPDLDNDKDGIPDGRDRCPGDPEDRDGFEDDDGCPDLDNDKDGIPDTADRCPNEPEDKDGFQDEDGCPELDNDGDGIPDDKDKCINEPETRNGIDDDDGCPESGAGGQVARLELPEVVHFDAGKDRPGPKLAALLDKLAARIKAARGVRRVRIEGHTDDAERPPKRRAELAQARANAVKAELVRRGVEPDRLQAVGYGDARPVDKKPGAEARARNRRVELIVVEQ